MTRRKPANRVSVLNSAGPRRLLSGCLPCVPTPATPAILHMPLLSLAGCPKHGPLGVFVQVRASREEARRSPNTLRRVRWHSNPTSTDCGCRQAGKHSGRILPPLPQGLAEENRALLRELPRQLLLPRDGCSSRCCCHGLRAALVEPVLGGQGCGRRLDQRRCARQERVAGHTMRATCLRVSMLNSSRLRERMDRLSRAMSWLIIARGSSSSSAGSASAAAPAATTAAAAAPADAMPAT